ncbi:DUF2974 domain-containing protein [Enterococcus faecalis]|uniref:DUF2974 domain-containing protein n=1 Tax=Enterococcus TaxID=1350 RepID=UPI00100E9A06|nr:DUF2974 domain-containing protein [Enterococcus faecalis]EGO8326066.1 DUF2974 domain-containing protein [Enterococcus faecalis]EIP8068018.1 DUF2974 domain-containing protein [Enterococcus faecalis]NSV50524.1 DUF2974 domain-containing protein [Enterococcus faecalis]NSV73768.1 DUF2974 domain-containing protein [Enterococcus faecalis]NSW33209.1 DUF2974 domain-containing protein [Enterococcus faecalis]
MDNYRKFSEIVYGVEKETTNSGDVIKYKGAKYLVIDTIDTDKDTLRYEHKPRSNSMQAMTVAEIKDEYKNDKNIKGVPGYPQSVINQNLTIVYAGTKSWQDWKTNFREIGFNDKHQAGAFQSALTYASQIERQYSPEAGYTINTTGHSLGGAEAIYVAVLKGYNAITYGAAGSGLTDEQIKNYKGQIINFYDTSDAVTSSFVTGGQGKIPFYSFGVDNYSGVIVGWVKKTFGHDLDMFKTDDAGNYIDKFGDIAVYSDGHGGVAIEQTILAQQILENKNRIRGLETYDGTNPETLAEINRLKKENKWLQEQLKQFNQLNELRVSLTASGGGLSSNERIYLEDSQALAVVKVAASQFDVAMEECLHIYKKVMQELQEDWENGLQLIQRHTPELSYAEMREAMDQVQCTKQTMVDQDLEYFQKKFSKINRIRTSFVQLTQQITAKINELVQRDQELANQLKGALT